MVDTTKLKLDTQQNPGMILGKEEMMKFLAFVEKMSFKDAHNSLVEKETK